MARAKGISGRRSAGRRRLLADLSVGARVSLLIALAFGALAALGGSYLAGERRLDASLERLMAHDAARNLAVGVEALAFRMQQDTKAFLLRRDTEAATRYQARAARVAAMLGRLRKGPSGKALDTHVDTVNDGMVQHAAQFRRVMEAGKASTALAEAEVARLDEILAYVAPGLEALARATTDAADRATAEAGRARRVFHVLVFAGLALIGILFAVPVFIIGRGIASPLAALAEAAREGDDFVPGRADGNEIGDIARALHVLKSNLAGMESLCAELRDFEERRVAEDDDARRALANTLLSASADVESGARDLLDGAKATKRRTAAVSEATRQAAIATDAAAAAVEGLTGSIGEIGQRVTRSAGITGQAVADTEGADQKIQGLADAVDKMGAVVALITEIAHQTHLLALNATIEAARAGAAGKVFAVVASEVKTLATQTATATKDITTHVGDIQAVTQSAVEAIQGIGGTIGDLNGLTADIAAAVEAERESSRDIGSTIRQVATGTGEIAAAAAAVAEAADATGRGIERMLETARALERQSQSGLATVEQLAEKMRD